MEEQTTVRRELTQYGFQFGSALVERCMELAKGAVVVSVTTPKHKLNIYVTKTGKMRAAPRWHQRRGHWRTLASGRRVVQQHKGACK
jgi:hypothetical protein